MQRKRLKRLLIKSIDLYRRYASPLRRPSCVFYPTCSEYAREAIMRYGAGKGGWMSFRRILRCHPWQKDRIDPVE